MNIDTRIKYRHLVCFLEVARQGSLARASDALSISQPALSKSIKELETLLSTTLFVRSKSGAALTEAGVAFMRFAGPSVQALREGVSSLRSGEHETVTARLGVLSTAESLLVPEVVSRLHAKHPALIVSVMTGPSAYLLSQLRVGELDLVVGRMTDSPQIQGLTFEHLYSESMTLVVRNDHPLLDAPLKRESLERFPLVLPLAGTTIRTFADSLFVQCGIQMPRQRLETLSLSLSRRYVQCSNAIWIAPLDAVSLELQGGTLVELDMGIREPGGSVGLCSNPALPLTRAAQWCVDELRSIGAAYCQVQHP
ncbi:LysR family transcriptional regulator, pca operon transcriptional activator [Pseudomonas syringae]|uniref:pca operon transcription factor PcaQ n=1 Tax=Pseudomonas syringae TaxID=317 RepID=UPI00089580E7|nr:pca operon transcription factor PcaQ [Pseudomonas syringae]SDW52129.1 LysR family transcriptional regulator, pca operon transcriptional activator [Pseudomonas syringae]SFL77373.1 LysR family transcriptional regulator, pca operon transcriptional activator [Pseudomonas syringae]